MRIKIVGMILLGVCLNAGTCLAQLVDIQTSPISASNPLPDHPFNSVYGYINYKIETPYYTDSTGKHAFTNPSALFYGLRQAASIISNAHQAVFTVSGKTKSTFVLTIEVLRGSEVLFREPLVAISSDNEYVLLMKKKSIDTLDLNKNKTIINYLPVTDDNNNLLVRMQAHAVEEGAFDLTVIHDLVGLGNQIGTIGTATLSPTTEATISAINKIIKAVFDTTRQATVSNAAELSFVKEGSGGNSNKAVATLSMGSFTVTEGDKTLKAPNMQIPIALEFGTQQTRLGGDDSIIGSTKVNIGTNKAMLWDALVTSNKQQVRFFLDELVTKESFMSKSAGAACLELYDTLFQYLTARDAARYYYAFLKKYKSALAASKDPQACTQGDASDRLEKWGIKLPTTNASFTTATLPDLAVKVVPEIGGAVLPLGTFPMVTE